MFNDGFYPTPRHVAGMMLEPYSLHKSISILDPAAGKGDLLDVAREQVERRNPYRRNEASFHAIEIENDLCAILRDKKYTLVGYDLFETTFTQHYDLVLMNPPFRNGIDFLMHVWDNLDGPVDIACLLNHDGLMAADNEKKQRLLQLIDLFGSVENIGPVFKRAERPTAVNIALVRLKKPAPRTEDVDWFSQYGYEVEETLRDGSFVQNALASTDALDALEGMYKAARRALKDKHEAQAAYDALTGPLRGDYCTEDDENTKVPSLPEAEQQLKALFWKYVFDKLQIARQVTSSAREKWYDEVKRRKYMAFSAANVRRVLYEFVENREDIIQACIVEAFDHLTKYHKENRVYQEGWKTTKAYMVASRFILPNVNSGYSSYGSADDNLNDLDKALCFLSGQALDNIVTTVGALHQHKQAVRDGRAYISDQFESTFFKVRVYKKGTGHFLWKDEALRAMFNQTAVAGKNWVGDGK